MPKNDDFTATGSATDTATHATQSATIDDARAATHATQWLTVAQAAELEGVSARAIQRRCVKGKYRSQRVQTPRGERIEVEADSLTNGAVSSATHATAMRDAPDAKQHDARDTQRDRRDEATGERARFIPLAVSQIPDADRKQTDHDSDLLHAQLDSARAEAKREREFSELLKSQLEDANRNAAELRAALRKALEIAPRQLTAATNNATTELGQERAPEVQANKMPKVTTNAVKSPVARAPRPLWKVVFGIR